MRIDLSYNDVTFDLFISNKKLDKDKMSLIRHKAFEFFDSVQEIFIEKKVEFCIKYPEELLVKEEFKPLGSLNVGEDKKTINTITGDKRVEKKKYEDMSIEELGVDVRGMSWNPEIHASTKMKRKDGTWKLKKGANLIQSAEKEKQILQDLPPPPPSDEEIEIKHREIPKTFNEMMNFIDEIIDTGRIDTTGVMKILGDLGFTSILHLRDNVPMYDKIYAQFHSALGGVL